MRHRVFDALLDSPLELLHGSRRVNRMTGNTPYPVQRSNHFGDAQRPAHLVDVTPVRRSSRLHAFQSGRRHLATGHPVNGVVDENHQDRFATVAAVNGFGRTDSRQVAVTLVGEHELFGHQTLDCRSQRRRAPVGGFLHIHVHIIVGQYGATHRSHADGLVLKTHFIYHFHQRTVDSSVTATGAVVHYLVGKQRSLLVN